MPGLEPGVVVRCGASFMGSALRRRLSVDRRTDHRDEGPVCQTSPRRRRRSPRTRTASLYPWHSTRSQAISPPGTEWTFSASRSGHHVDAVVRGAGSVLVAAGVPVRLVSGASRGVPVQLVARGPVPALTGVPQRVEGVVVAVVAAREVVGDVVEDLNLDDITNNLTGGNYGDNDTLDALWNACEGGDWAACDQLYWDSPGGSAYESFGDTCGNRTDGSLLCVDELGGGTQTEPNAYGDDTTLDALWDACTAEDWQARDDLYDQSDVGSGYEAYGDTCGNKYAAGTTDYCVDVMP